MIPPERPTVSRRYLEPFVRPMTRVAATIVALTAAAVLIGGCFTGPRPVLREDSTPAATGDPSVDALVASLQESPAVSFTATYRITNNFGGESRDAIVARRDDGRISVTIGDVRFLYGSGPLSTCSRGGDGELDCTDSIDDAAVSDMQVTHQFFDRSAAQRLSADASRRVGTVDTYEAVFAERTAQCVGVPVDGGSKVYCVTPEGVLAAYQGPDVMIELTGWIDTVDESLYIPHT